MALFPSVIPWTLVLTQVMTAGLAVVPVRWAHLFRKCLQVQVLCGWERAQGDPRGRGYDLSFGLALRWKKEKKNPFALVKKLRRKVRTWGRSVPSSGGALSQHAHVNIECQDLHGRVEQVISIQVMSNSQTQRLPHRWTSSPPHEKRRHVIQPDYTV